MASRFFVKAAVMAIAMVVFGLPGSAADAGWPHRGGGSGGSDGGSVGGYGSGGSHGSVGGSASDGGSHGGRIGWRARRHGSGGGSAGGGSYGGGSAGGGSYGGGSYGGGSYGGGSYGGGSYGGGSYGGTLVVTPELASHVPVSSDAVLLTVEVPRDAKVWINKYETGSTGETRLFTSHGMTAEKKYDFAVRMRAYIDGKWVDETKTVSLEAGERETISLAKVIEEKAAAQAAAKSAAPAAPAPPAAPQAPPAKANAQAVRAERADALVLVGD
jgi:uncharacterized protein (TIGR03000 family)